MVKGDADVVTLSVPALKDYLEAGQAKLLACMLPNRISTSPDVQTVKEQNFGDAYSIWFGAFVPLKTPDNVVKQLSDTFFKVMATPKIP